MAPLSLIDEFFEFQACISPRSSSPEDTRDRFEYPDPDSGLLSDSSYELSLVLL
jgi:hypothetical protein